MSDGDVPILKAPPLTAEQVLENIRNPRKWINPDALIQLVIDNPSLRGFAYGYVSENEFCTFLNGIGIDCHFKEDDHKKTKSDRTFDYEGKRYTVQLKSLQTNSIKEIAPGQFLAKIQNDASDRRRIVLPDGTAIETTCYQIGEYDILGVSLQPFTGQWGFAFKKNRLLKTSKSKKYTPEIQRYLLATLEDISYPLTEDWTTDLVSLLNDPELGSPIPGQ